MKLVAKQYYHNRNIFQANLSNLEQTDIPYYCFYKCSNLSNICFPTNLTNIEKYAFSFCNNISSLEFPASLKKIDDFSFEYCQNLLSIEIPESVEYIGDGAFEQCENLKLIVIPNNIKYIHPCAFINCKKSVFESKHKCIEIIKQNTTLSTIGEYLEEAQKIHRMEIAN